MTDYAEEQMMEVEALESIYADDFQKLSDDPLSYKVHLVPNPGEYDQNHDVEAQFEVVLEKGLTSVQEKEIRRIIEEQSRENAGMVSVFTVAEAVKEYLMENNREDLGESEYHQMLKRQEAAEKVKVNESKVVIKAERDDDDLDKVKKFDGTPVTPETFKKWLDSFEREMEAKEQNKAKKSLKENILTGKQLFLQGVVDGSEEAGADGEDDDKFVAGAVDQSVFLGEDDDDLDDLDDEDYEDEDE